MALPDAGADPEAGAVLVRARDPRVDLLVNRERLHEELGCCPR
jgi:hypothetical protein